MQRRFLKIVGILAILSIIFSPAFCQTTSYRLKTADSLFLAKKYTQSFGHYQEMLRQREHTPAMLLKMAFIQEGLANIGQAMYYLNLYFLSTHDDAALQKMDELAEKNGLIGYEPAESDRILSSYREHYRQISLALAAVGLLVLAGMFYSRMRLHRKPVELFVVMLLVLSGIGAHLYIGQKSRTAILTATSTYVMGGPSAAASVLQIVKGGHKVQVLGRKDIWVKIDWAGQEAYVRDHAVLPVML